MSSIVDMRNIDTFERRGGEAGESKKSNIT